MVAAAEHGRTGAAAPVAAVPSGLDQVAMKSRNLFCSSASLSA